MSDHPTTTAPRACIPDGCYMSLPIDLYRTDPARGGTDRKEILTSATNWHGRRRNAILQEALQIGETIDPEKAKTRDAGKRFGTALHVMLLDGPEAFDAIYCDEPEAPDLPATKEAIAHALTLMGRSPPKMGAKRIEFVAEARMAGLRISDDWMEERAMLVGGREAISRRWTVALRITRGVLEKHSRAMRFLTKGRAEVSCFWTDEHGDRFKVRFDYLHPRPLVDLKTYAYKEGQESIATFFQAAERYGYDFQAAAYMEARRVALPRLVEAGKVYNAIDGDDGVWMIPTPAREDDTAFMERVAAEPDPRWVWVAAMTLGVPEIHVIEFPETLIAFQAAGAQVAESDRIYRDMRAKFGPSDDELWLNDTGLVRATEFNWSQRQAGRGAVLYESVD